MKQSWWSRVSPLSKLRVVFLCASIPVCTVAIVLPRGEGAAPASPSEFDRRVDARSATLSEWGRARLAEKQRFAALYTRGHLGRSDPKKADDIRRFLDAHLRGIRKRVPSPNAVEAVARTGIWTLAAAGARLMRWPASQAQGEPRWYSRIAFPGPRPGRGRPPAGRGAGGPRGRDQDPLGLSL